MWSALAGLLGSAITAGSGLATGLYGISANQANSDRQLAESQRQFDAMLAWQQAQYRATMKWQTEMANTAHQREVEDLRAAGLNPILSATGGNGAPTGAMTAPSSVSPTVHADYKDAAGVMSLIQQGVSSAIDQGQRAVDLYSQMGLRAAQSAESLSKAAQNEELTPAMKSKFIAEASASAAAANLNNVKASSMERITPAQLRLLDSQVLQNTTSAFEGRKRLEWADQLNKSTLQRNQATTDYLATMERVNTIRTVLEGLRTGSDLADTVANMYSKGMFKGIKGFLKGKPDRSGTYPRMPRNYPRSFEGQDPSVFDMLGGNL